MLSRFYPSFSVEKSLVHSIPKEESAKSFESGKGKAGRRTHGHMVFYLGTCSDVSSDRLLSLPRSSTDETE